MKKIILGLIALLFVSILFISCGKDDPGPSGVLVTKPDGIWLGTAQYGTTPGGTTYDFKVTFKADSSLTIIGDNTTGIDNATGTWKMVQDSVQATYKYASSSAIYMFSAKFATNATVMNGTIGLQPAVSGVGLFSIIKQ
ncbi:MAG TPA: hypothetical protein PK987_12580 [Ferruginibacter sp.]|nr:hypothetical protein [Ferruginibacter sp.]